ncbi:hypothetical protein R6Q59_028156 [Mikania micrantha]|uniref:Uncharacterized protein n=1 Tax=Mikania micrantha TaxID=192012 RepID=A0A5N6M829_9ASTR|nr:hypothetical protein E3N88_32314 [Mikania micrantha]
MEWYFGNDLVVPKDYEQAEMISSPELESWSQWGMTGFGSSFSRKSFDSNVNMTHEELTFNGGKDFYTSIDMADSNNEKSKSNNSSMSQELYNNGGSLLWNDEADFQQFAEEEARINHMDDIFFSSLLEEDPTKPHDKTVLGNTANIIEGEMVNLARDEHSIGSSKYVKTRAFLPSTNWANGEVSTTYRPPKQYTSNVNSMEESALNDFERVTAQFTDKTRICFRDAFYRLAENSKQSHNSCPVSMMICHDDTLRVAETNDSESKTNVIDRAVASLVFHNFSLEDTCIQHQIEHNDVAEVPIRGMQELLQPTAY